MKSQFSSYDAIISVSILLIFFFILNFSIPRTEFDKEKYIKFLSYDILLALDRTQKINASYGELYSNIGEILINLGMIPDFLITEEGLWKREINISCICDKEILLLLNNIYRNIDINGRKISINFFSTNFPLIQTDFERHGLIIFDCNEEITKYSTVLKRYLTVNGILFVCDINQTYFDLHRQTLLEIFNITTGFNNGNSYATLIKPKSGSLAQYRAFKILKYQYNITERQNLLTSNIVVVPRDENMYLFRQEGSNIAAVTLTYYNENIVGWSSNFYRDRNLDEEETKILLALILSTVSYKEPFIFEKYRKTLIPYISFQYKFFLEPFILYFSIST